MLMVLISTLLIVLFFLVDFKHKRKLDYWKKKNVPYLPPVPLFGNFKDYILLKQLPGVVLQQICEKFPDAPYVGAFYGTDPVLIVQDPEIIKLVITKNFNFFNGREASDYSEYEVGTQSVFFVCCDKWRILRQNLSPLFSTAKMKNMFHLIEKCSRVFENMLQEKVTSSPIVAIDDIMAHFTMDCVGSCTFGVDTNVMTNPSNNPFYKIGKSIFDKSTYRGIKNVLRSCWPGIFYFFRFRFFPPSLNNFFNDLLTEVFQARQNKPTSRHDFVDLILTLTNNNGIDGESVPDFKTGEVKKIKMEVTIETLVGQCISFFGAGYETSSVTACLTLYELARNVEAQEKAVQEIDSYLQKHNNQLDYDIVHEVPYLEACIDEALRFYPALGSLHREAMTDYTFPSGLRIEKGTRIHIPVYYLQRHPKYFADPEAFRPERFLGEEKMKIDPHVYMPFGGGPRLCIGLRFAKMQMLCGLVTLLKNYRVELLPDKSNEIIFDTRVLITCPRDPVYVKLIPRNAK